MIHAPLRGIFFLGRAAFIVAAAAAVPILIKKNKRWADQLGDSLIRAGENLKKHEEPAPKATPESKAATPKPAAKPAAKSTASTKSAPRAARPRAAKPSAKAKPASRARTKKAAPKPKPPEAS